MERELIFYRGFHYPHLIDGIVFSQYECNPFFHSTQILVIVIDSSFVEKVEELGMFFFAKFWYPTLIGMHMAYM